MLLLEERTENDIVNIGAGEDYSIREFAELICEISGTSTDCLQFDTTRYVGAKAKMLSNNKLDRLLPNRSTTSLRKGLEATISWVEQVFFMNKVH